MNDGNATDTALDDEWLIDGRASPEEDARTETDGGNGEDARSIGNVVANLGGYGIYAERADGGGILVRENPRVPTEVRRQGYEWLDEQGFERDEAATRERDDHWTVFSR